MAEMTPEQAQALKEKVSSMSPEELKEFQKKQCIFCQIISGKVASKKVYSDEKCTAILDINPANPGHILLLPNEHYGIMPLVPPDELKHLFMTAKALCHVSLKALEAQGTNIFIANGVAAGQKAQHFMLHVIPRKEGDNVKLDIPEKTIKADEMKQVIDRIRPAVEKALGAPPKEEAKPEEKEEAEEEKPEEGEKEEEMPEEEIEEKEEAEEEKEIEEVKKESKKPAKKKKPKKKKPAKKKEKPEEVAEEPPTLDDISSLLTGGA